MNPDRVLATGSSVGRVWKAAGLDPAGLPEHDSPEELVAALIEAEKPVEAITFLAHALPTREAVWWAWSCARRASGEDPPEEIRASLEATGAWISDPTDARRRAAYELAQKADMATPAGCAGAAVFFSGGSMGPPDQPEMPPGEYMAAKAIAGAVLLAAASDPAEAEVRLETYLRGGMDVAERVHLWQPPGSGGPR
jgi:hypothetical protein